MAQIRTQSPAQTEPADRFAELQARVRGTNISEQTLLATDYLNHFSEIVMLIEMIPDSPELLETAREWRPKTYQEHFADSAFSDKELAIEAYEFVPPCYRAPFEETIARIDRLVPTAIERLIAALDSGQTEEAPRVAQTAAAAIGKLIDRASGIIHGNVVALSQDEINRLI